MSSLKTYVTVFGLLLIAFSAVQIGLSAYALSFYRGHQHDSTDATFVYTTTATAISYNYYWLPNHVLNRSYALQVATGALGVAIGFFVLLISALSKSFSFPVTGRNAPRTFAWSSISAAATVLFLLLAIPSLVVTFYDYHRHGQGQLEYMSACLAQLSTDSVCNSSRPLVAASYTIEGWICAMYDTYARLQYRLTPGAGPILHRTCRVTDTAKWWTIPMLIIPLPIIIFALLEKRDRNIREYHASNIAGAKESSFSSSNSPTIVPSNSVRSPVSPMSDARQSEMQGDFRPSVEVPSKQFYEVPGAHHNAGHDEMAASPHQMYSELPAAKSKEQVK